MKDGMHFTITTSKEVAEQIKKQCEWDEKFRSNRSFVLGEIAHHKSALDGSCDGFSVVQIKAKDGLRIEPSDIFWLGHFSANKNF